MPYQIQNGVITSPVQGYTALGNGLAINSGTLNVNSGVTLTGTAAGTVTIAPAQGVADVVLNLPNTGGGTVTVAATPTFQFQEVLLHIKQGATLAHVSLNSGFIFGAGGGGPASYADATQTVSVVDHLKLFSPDGTKYLVQLANLNAAL